MLFIILRKSKGKALKLFTVFISLEVLQNIAHRGVSEKLFYECDVV